MIVQREDATAEFIVRRASAADAAAIHSVLSAAFCEFQHLYTPEAYVATVVPAAAVIVRLQQGPVWVAERQSSVIGTVSAHSHADSVIVRGMAVNPNERGLGVGRVLLRVTEDFARVQGCARLCLYTTPFLGSAIRLYQTSGFAFTGKTLNPHGTELLEMAKEFGP